MKTLELIIGVLVVIGFIVFIAWSTYKIFTDDGPDESTAQVRYDEADNCTKLLA